MGFDDKGTFEIYQTVKNNISNFDEKLVKSFAQELVKNISRRLFIGWQDTSTYNYVKGDIELMIYNDDYSSLGLDHVDGLLDLMMQSVVDNYSLN